jgi:hypothetical protein
VCSQALWPLYHTKAVLFSIPRTPDQAPSLSQPLYQVRCLSSLYEILIVNLLLHRPLHGLSYQDTASSATRPVLLPGHCIVRYTTCPPTRTLHRHSLTLCSTLVFEKLIPSQLLKEIPALEKPESYQKFSQQHVIAPSSERDESNLHPQNRTIRRLNSVPKRLHFK